MDLTTVMSTSYAAYGYAIGKPFPLFRDAAEDEKEKWKRFALAAPGVFARLAGRPVKEVAETMRRASLELPPGHAEDVPRAEMLAWEAATRHLAQVIDQADELDPARLKELERTWRQWADKRTIKLGVR